MFFIFTHHIIQYHKPFRNLQIEVTEVIGDKAYSGKENIEYGHEKGIKIIAIFYKKP